MWLRLTACGILIPQPGIEHAPLAMKALSPNHWTAREFPQTLALEYEVSSKIVISSREVFLPVPVAGGGGLLDTDRAGNQEISFMQGVSY